MSRILAYVRVSHRDSVIRGLSPETQRDAIERYAELLDADWHPKCFPHGEKPGFFFDLEVSAWKHKISERPAGAAMLAAAQPGDHIVFWRLDRGFRSVQDFAATVPAWLERGIQVHFVSQRLNLGSANGKLMANMLAAFAQWKSDMISERTKAGLARRGKGKKTAPVVAQPVMEANPAASRLLKSQWKKKQAEPGAGVVYSYIRVSTEEQASSGLGLAAQRHANAAYINLLLAEARAPLEIGQEFSDEAVSAYTTPFNERPSGKALSQLLKAGDHIVFARLDRGFRDVRDLLSTWEAWKEKGVTMHLADTALDSSTATGRMMLSILGMFAEMESADNSERTIAGKQRAAQEGRSVGEVMMGFKRRRRNGKVYIELDEDCVKEMAEIAALSKQGLGWRRISHEMERRIAQREGRKEIPMCGIHRKFAKEYISKGHTYRHVEAMQRTEFLNRRWTGISITHALENWPVVSEIARSQGVDFGDV